MADEQPTAPGGPPAPGAPPGAPPAAGRLIGGYLLEELCGAGGMGVVYRARERALGRAVALKLIAPQYARDPGFRALFVQESLAAAALEHPNVVPIYRAGEDQGELFIAMRYVEGQSLAELIAAHGRLEPALVGRILVQAAAALDAAHAAGLVHRDVKPANILIAGEEGQERVYLTDFGLSALAGTGLGALGGRFTGTLGYLAPEQIRGGPLDARTDVYALGCVLYHALTGELAFPERSPAEVLVAHLSAPPPRPSARRPELPAGFDQVIARALAKRPADRYQSAGALAEAAAGLGFDVVLCHGPAEREAAGALAERLLGRGLEPWWTAGRIGPGEDPARAGREGLRGSACCAVLVGPDGLGEWAREPLALAGTLGLPLISVLTPGAPEPFDPRLSFLAGRPWVDLREGLDDQKGLQALSHAIRRERRAGLPGGVGAGAEAVCPYRGLEAFEEDDARFFCGREKETGLLVERLRAGRFVCVLGPSGSGKSSLVRAGLVPALKAGALAGSERWRYLSLAPGARPLEALCAALSGAFPERADGLTPHALRADPAALDSWLSAAMAERPAEERALLLVDQFEELFALCPDGAERRAFLEALRYGAAIPGGRLATVLCMRADFYHRLAEHPPLHELAAAHQQLLGPLGQAELRRAIAEPAARAGLELEPGLTEAMLEDLAERPGALPLLQHLLLELWQRRRGAELTLEAYAASGGVQGALGARAEALWQALEAPEQQIVRRALLRLVVPGEGAEDTRRRAERRELAGTPEQEPALERVLGALAGARLLSLGRDEASGEPTVELAHEALIRGWPRLSGWIADEREGLRAQAQLAGGAREWEQAGREEALLLRGARLAGWQERGEQGLSALEREFLGASRLRAERERRARRRRLRLAFGGLGGGLLALGAVAGVALWQRGVANGQRDAAAQQRDTAISRQFAAVSDKQLAIDPEVALLLAIAAYERRSTAEAEESLAHAIVASRVRASLPTEGGSAAAAFGPDGRQVTVADGEGIRMWSWRRPGSVRLLTRRVQFARIAFSPNGRRLLALGGTHAGALTQLRVIDARSGQTLAQLGRPALTRLARRAAFSPDGRLVLAATPDGARIWRLSSGALMAFLRQRGSVSDAAFSPDGRLIVTSAQDGGVRVWDWRQSRELAVLQGRRGLVFAIAFSPDGRRVASAGGGTVRIWDWRRGRTLTVIHAAAFALGFSPDGREVVTGHGGGAVRVWDSRRGDELALLLGHRGPVSSVAFRPDGRYVLTSASASTAGAADRARVWDWASRPMPRFLARGQGRVDAVFRADGGRLLVVDNQRGLSVFDRAARRRRASLRPTRPVSAASFAPTGREVVFSAGFTMRSWDPMSGHVRTLLHRGADELAPDPDGHHLLAVSAGKVLVLAWPSGRPVAALPGASARYAAFSADGRLIAEKRIDGSARVYDWAGGRLLATLPASGRGSFADDHGVAFAPDGRRLAIAGVDGSIRVWDWASRVPLIDLHVPYGAATTVAFSGDGGRIAAWGAGAVRVWDAMSGAPLAEFPDPAAARSTTFDRGGRLIVTGDVAGAVRVWRCEVCVSASRLLALGRSRVTRELTPDERRTFGLEPQAPAPVRAPTPVSRPALGTQAPCEVATPRRLPAARPGVITTPLGGRPVGVALGYGSVWVARYAPAPAGRDPNRFNRPELARLDAGSGRPLSCIAAGTAGPAIGEGAIWAGGPGKALRRIDPRTGQVVAVIPLRFQPAAVAVGAGAVWALQPFPGRRGMWGSLMRVDPATNRPVATIPLVGRRGVNDAPQRLAVGEGAVWVTDTVDMLFRVDPATNRIVARIRTGPGPIGVAAGAGAVWVALNPRLVGSGRPGSLLKIDPRTDRVVASVRLRYPPSDVAIGDTAVWVSDYTGVVAVDPRTARVVGTRITTGRGPGVLAVDDNAVWVGNNIDGTVSRIDPSLLRP